MIKRGDVYFADLSPVIGSEQGGTRPVLVIQNNLGNHFSPTIIVAAITAKMIKSELPTHVSIHADQTGIERDSVILLEQLRTIDKSRLKEKVCHLDQEIMEKVDMAIGISVGLVTTDTQKKKRKNLKSNSKTMILSENSNNSKNVDEKVL